MAEEIEPTEEELEDASRFSRNTVLAYRILAHAAMLLENEGVELLMSAIAVGVRSDKPRRVVVIGNPSMPSEVLKALLETIGKDADVGVDQSNTINALVEEAITEERANACEDCPDRETCESRVVKETIH